MEITLESIIGKTVIIGVTYYDEKGEIKNRKQFYGKFHKADNEKITVLLDDGKILYLPSDLRSTNFAPPGEYTFKETGKIVVNPDFKSIWNVYPQNED